MAGGCIDETESKRKSPQYYSLKEYFKGEAERLHLEDITIHKTAIKDEIAETIAYDSISWEKEFRIFKKMDINKPAWMDSYEADTTELSGLSYRVIYTAIEEDLSVRRVELLFKKRFCTEVRIDVSKSNYVYEMRKQLLYNRGVGYTIAGHQKMRWFPETSYSISATFEDKP